MMLPQRCANFGKWALVLGNFRADLR